MNGLCQSIWCKRHALTIIPPDFDPVGHREASLPCTDDSFFWYVPMFFQQRVTRYHGPEAPKRPRMLRIGGKVDMCGNVVSLLASGSLTGGVSLEKQQRAAPASTTLTPLKPLLHVCTYNTIIYYTKHYTYSCKALAACTYDTILYYTYYTYPCKALATCTYITTRTPVLTMQYYTTLTPAKPVKLLLHVLTILYCTTHTHVMPLLHVLTIQYCTTLREGPHKRILFQDLDLNCELVGVKSPKIKWKLNSILMKHI